MPTGGVSGSGTGLQLQATTPGTADTGNANITGRLICQNGSNLTGIPPFAVKTNTLHNLAIDPIIIGDFPTFTGGGGNANNSAFNSIFVGRAITLQQNVNGNPQYNNVMIGSIQIVKGGDGVTIGQNNLNGNDTAYPAKTMSPNVVIGNNTQSTFMTTSPILDGSVAIGPKSGDMNGIAVLLNGSVCIGYLATSSNTTGNNIVIGRSLASTGTNNILVGVGSTVGTDNTIKIGDPSHTSVKIGPIDLTNGVASVRAKQIANVTIANTAAETSIIGAVAGSLTLIGNTLLVGSTVRIRARGTIADTLTPTLRLRVKLGAVTYLDTTATTIPALTGTHGWVLDAEITVRTLGAGGTAIGNGITFVSVAAQPDLDTTNTATSGIDTTVDQALDITAQWGTAAPANTLTCTHMTMEVLG